MEVAQRECDVLVLGSGPSGSAISALLAKKGWKVEVLEKDTHPRFHIGESLLPHTLPFLEQLGVLDDVQRIGLKKLGAELISHEHEQAQTLYFSQAMDKSYPYAYQVRRAEFDAILVQNAIKHGVRVHQNMTATSVSFSNEAFVEVSVIKHDRQAMSWRASFLVDATGRETFLASQLGLKRKSRTHNSVAIFNHFEGVKRHQGSDEGNITICWFQHGWFWIIPFKDGVTSVGAVCWPSYLRTRSTDLDTFFWETIRRCPPIANRLNHATMLMPTHATGNYSYQATRMTGERFILVGDAFAFVDPVFSSGVHLALNSAILGAEVVDASLHHTQSAHQLVRSFERLVTQGLSTYSWFIHRFTQPSFRNLFMAPRNTFRIEEAIMSVLAGDVFGKTSTTFPLLLFKTLYYLSSLFDLRANFRNYRLRKLSTRHSS